MERVIIIAEAGVNHNGSFETAKQMVDVAKAAGVDYIKFQTFVSEKLVSINAKMAEYQEQNTGKKESQLSMLKKLELSQKEFEELKAYCEEKEIGFLSTPFDLESIEFLNNLGMDFFKIPSGEITNYPYLVKIARTGTDVVMSTGMCEMEEIEQAVEVLKKNGTKNISLLHCNTEYPTPYEDVNLKAMDTLAEVFQVSVGYSDHTQGIEVPIAAVARGAVVIEKHFTLDKNMEGPDHKASLEPKELQEMVKAIRNIEKALGNGEKRPSGSEKKNIAVARKSIVASKNIKKGEVFTENNLTVKRPGDGISPMLWEEIIGKAAKRDFEAEEKIEV
ncbi:MAG: N-acetylneuraminate synthase [Lachnospiraceae bacterium]|nr:N-acetylneuraminate synthase [Lachnospiraceae bacterium]